MKRSVQLVLGILLAVLAFAGVMVFNTITRPPTFDVAVVVVNVSPFTPLTAEMVQIDSQVVSDAVLAKYVLADEWQAMLASGEVVAVETLYPGQPLMRELVATGENAGKVRRLSVALTDPNQVILSVPVDETLIPQIYPGDAVALFYSAGQLQAQRISTDVVHLPDPLTSLPPTPEPQVIGAESYTETVTLELPLSKWIANGIVYRLNREQRENPNYGAPGMENEPRYVEGAVKSLDVVVHRKTAEWVAFALAHGKVQVAVLPAVAIPALQTGTLPPSTGVTWTDLEQQFFADRPELLQPRTPLQATQPQSPTVTVEEGATP